jgi:hypothetical protein
VDWIDLLAYSALLIKSPATVARMRREPDDYLYDPTTARGIERHFANEKSSPEERLNSLIPASEQNDATKKLLGFLLPSLSDDASRQSEHTDAFYERRPLLTTLRLSLLPGAFSREAIQSLVKSSPEEIEAQLRQAFDNGVLGALTDRLDDLYLELSSSFNHVYFWKSVGAFARKPDCEWMTSYIPMRESIRGLATVLERAVVRKPEFRKNALEVFNNLRSAGESELTARWLRLHLFVYGLYGKEKRGGDAWFLNAEQTEALARDMANTWRPEHLSGKLIPCRWDLQPVYTMIDTGIWDDLCRKILNETLAEVRAIDGFTLMLFGGAFTTDKSTIAAMCDYDSYIKRVQERLDSTKSTELDETVRVACGRFLGKKHDAVLITVSKQHQIGMLRHFCGHRSRCGRRASGTSVLASS